MCGFLLETSLLCTGMVSEHCDGLAPGGSTNIEDLLAVSGLSLLPSNVMKRPIPKSVQRSNFLRAKTFDTENKP